MVVQYALETDIEASMDMYILKSYDLEAGATGSWQTMTSGSIPSKSFLNSGMSKTHLGAD